MKQEQGQGQGLSTKLVHAGEASREAGSPVNTPIYQSAMFTETSGEVDYHAVRYIRLNNLPNQIALADKLAAIGGAEAALVAASGMAAISTALISVLQNGDHLLAQSTLYGGTHKLFHDELKRMGVEVELVKETTVEAFASRRRPNTKAIYLETLSNPLLQVGDLLGLASWARNEGLVSMIDNTAASPLGFRPCQHGFDLSLHSATKYLNGHSDIVAGAILGSAKLVAAAKARLDHLGGSLDPHACFLLQRGMKTLSLRFPRQAANALALAQALEAHEMVGKVHYPGLPSHPDHLRANELLDSFGGLLSFELQGGATAADAMISALELPRHAPSFGGVESLVTRPAASSHSGMSPAERAEAGIPEGLIRVSVGIEDIGDLLADFRQALVAAAVAA